MNTLTDIGILTPADVTFFTSAEGFIGAKLHDREVPRVTVARALPFSTPESYLCIQDEDKKELGILRDLQDFPEEQRKLLHEALRMRYFSPQILEIRSVRDKMGYLYLDVRIEGGDRVFAVKDYSRNLRAIDAHRLMITDVEGNRYQIEDIEALDLKSRRRLEPYLL
ncbi:MAG: DUF1854 domain-containing protein [Clostridiaceae bacterium]|nr:DUF1854 domain-containing protein [Clostridiaceae bacterium]